MDCVWRSFWRLLDGLKETRGTRIFRGFVKASEMLNRSEENGVFVWAPRLKDWLKDPVMYSGGGWGGEK